MLYHRKLHDRSVELHEARERMRVLEKERAEQAKEVKQRFKPEIGKK